MRSGNGGEPGDSRFDGILDGELGIVDARTPPSPRDIVARFAEEPVRQAQAEVDVTLRVHSHHPSRRASARREESSIAIRILPVSARDSVRLHG